MMRQLFKLMTGRAMLLLIVDVNDKADIQRHITRLEHIRDGVIPTVESEKRKLRFENLNRPFEHKLILRNADGSTQTFSRESHPKFLELLDYLNDHPEAEDMSVRKLGEAVGVSKSLADEAKHYWVIDINREAFDAFREQEEAGTPF